MDDIDRELAALFDRGEPATLADLGGTAFLQGRETEIARALLMPEILTLVLREKGGLRGDLTTFAAACAAVEVGGDGADPGSYKDAMEALAAAQFDGDFAMTCQDILTARAGRSAENEVARWVALGASLQIAVNHPETRHDLQRVLVRLKSEDPHPEFLRRAAKVVGVVNSLWPDENNEKVLARLVANECARDEASFELGMAHLRRGLESSTLQEVGASFEEAESHFDTAIASREHRPDAVAYRGALAMLAGLHRGDDPTRLKARSSEISEAVGIRTAWSPPEEAPWKWMGAGAVELIQWGDLAVHLADVAEGVAVLEHADPAVDIRRRLLDTYVANRAVLGRGPGGVETYIQPVVDGHLLKIDRQRQALELWLQDERNDGAAGLRGTAATLMEAAIGLHPPSGKYQGAATRAT